MCFFLLGLPLAIHGSSGNDNCHGRATPTAACFMPANFVPPASNLGIIAHTSGWLGNFLVGVGNDMTMRATYDGVAAHEGKTLERGRCASVTPNEDHGLVPLGDRIECDRWGRNNLNARHVSDRCRHHLGVEGARALYGNAGTFTLGGIVEPKHYTPSAAIKPLRVAS